jgi:hypothetical protein
LAVRRRDAAGPAGEDASAPLRFAPGTKTKPPGSDARRFQVEIGEG